MPLIFTGIVMAGLNLVNEKKALPIVLLVSYLAHLLKAWRGAAALLIGSGFLPLAAIRFALILKSVSVSYSIVGIPTNTAAATVEVAQQVAANNAEGFRMALSKRQLLFFMLLYVRLLFLSQQPGYVSF